MKKLLLSSVTFLSTISFVNAQAPAEWQVGQDVAAEIGLGDCSGAFEFSGSTKENNNVGASDVSDFGKYWKGDVHPNEYGGTDKVHLLGYYNQPAFNIYQVVRVPAGQYTVRVQSHYREGTPASSFQTYFADTPKKYAFVYATILPDENPESAPVRNFEKNVVSIAASGVTQLLYQNPDVSWQNDASGIKTEEDGTKTTYYCPSCVKGVATYFAAGAYWNEMNIVVMEDSYVRIGFKKIKAIDQDSFPFGNLQVVYNGPVSAEAELESAKEDCRNALSELETFKTDVEKAEFTGFAGAIDDLQMEFNDKIDEAETTEETDKILADIKAITAKYTKSYSIVKQLSDLFDVTEYMTTSTDYAGFDAFKTAYETAKKEAMTDDVAAIGDDPTAYFTEIFKKLSEARATYLNTQIPDEKGAIDFSSLISYPWFVNPAYTPTHNDDGTWTMSETTWQWGSVGNPDSYLNKLNEAGKNRVDISSKVVLYSDNEVTNQWFKNKKALSGWSAGVGLYYQGGLIGVSQGWADGFDGYEGIAQQLVGLPNGYYSLKGLVRGNGTDGHITYNEDNLPPYHNIFAENTEGECVRSAVGHTDGYYSQYGWYEWNPNTWKEHQTGTIMINDGKLLIGGQSSMVSNFTGFRLMYYGMNPPFNDMINEQIDNVKKDAEALKFPGDIKAVNNILSNITLPLPDADAYTKALDAIAQAKDYISKATSAMKNYNAENTFNDLNTKFEGDADACEIIATALAHILITTDAEDATYEIIEVLNADAAQYSKYFELYSKIKKFNNERTNEALAPQVADLKNNYRDAENLKKYMGDLNIAYNMAYMKSLGAGDASEADPVNITDLIVNPTFTNSPSNGWSGETPTINEYGRGNAELWNKNPFTLSQKISSLPAGTYELRVKAIYRDGGAVNADLVKAYDEAGSEEAWANHNALLFAKTSDDNDQTSYIKALESLKGTKNSFTYVATAFDEEETGDGNINKFVTKFQKIKETEIPADEVSGEPTIEEKNDGEYPFDTHVDIDGTTYYFPSSMQGFYQWCLTNPEAVSNKVRITIEKGETLEIGIRKTASINSDWVIFDDFELYYLTGDKFKETETGVENIKIATDDNAPAYNVAGQPVNNSYKGIVIKKGVKVLK